MTIDENSLLLGLIYGALLRLGDYRLENDPAFLQRIDRARQNLQAGRGVRLEDVADEG